ncbi:unnamed protein product [Lactuca virosa]|uniref:Uncharacterized protein n=1 Tax=Lactuca virosa TaxID=75947 RepID=A0AAU9NBC9_9ASTR|nr:unnamed protein product [Lactuca virosa]
MEGLYLIFFHVQLYIEKTALYLMSTKFLKAKLIEYFYTSTDYGHLVSKMGSEYLPKLLSQQKKPGIISLINKGFKERKLS